MTNLLGIKLLNNLSLAVLRSPVYTADREERNPVNWVFIGDRSGSMHSTIGKVIDDMIKKLDMVDNGDTFTYGWFSTEGTFAFPIKNMKVGSNKNEIIALLNKQKSTVALTCFSEILSEIVSFSKDMPHMRVLFFTDGYPVVSNYDREVSEVMSALEQLSHVAESIMLVGYGDWYNRELMSEMAKKCGGMLVHSTRLSDFTTASEKFVISDAVIRETVSIPVDVVDDIIMVFSHNSGYVDLEYEILPVTIDDGGNSSVSVRTSHSNIVFIFDNSMHIIPASETKYSGLVENSVYLAAHVALENSDVQLAQDIMSGIGDRYVVQRISDSWTNEELAATSAYVLTASTLLGAATRFAKGKEVGCAPSDSFCLLDVLKLLSDSESRFVPDHWAFEYKRIGVPKKPAPGYPEFVYNHGQTFSMSDVVWNSTRMNLSIRVRYTGTVKLGNDASGYNLPKQVMVDDNTIMVGKYSTYTIVKDGVLWTRKLSVIIDQDTANALIGNGVLVLTTEDCLDGKAICVIDLTSIPLINKSTSTPVSFIKYSEWCNEELKLEYLLKAFKNKKDELDPGGTSSLSVVLTPEQVEYLKKYGVSKDLSYAPPMEAQEATDQYEAPTMKVSIRSFSSTPKISDVVAKMKSSSSKMTQSEELMAMVLKEIDQLPSDKDKALEEVNTKISSAKHQLKVVREKLNRTRFGMLLSGRWFTGEDKKTKEASTTLDGKVFSVKFGKELQEY